MAFAPLHLCTLRTFVLLWLTIPPDYCCPFTGLIDFPTYNQARASYPLF